MPEEKIFGPLTFKQFIRLAIGVALAYAALTYLQGIQAQLVSGAIIVVTLLATFVKGSNSDVFDVNRIDEYIRKMDLEKGRDNAMRFLQKKIAEISSQIEMRRIKGLQDDPALEQALKSLEDAGARLGK